MKALHGYEIHPNGYVTTSLPRKEIGINRLRFLCGKCTTSVLFFPRKDFNEFTQSVVKQIEEKAKAAEIGFIPFHCESGEGLFLFDWLLRSGRNLSLKRENKNNFVGLVIPDRGSYMYYYSLLFSTFGGLTHFIYKDAIDDFYLIKSDLNSPKSFGKARFTPLTRKEADSKPIAEEEFLRIILHLNSDSNIEIEEINVQEHLYRRSLTTNLPNNLREVLEKDVCLGDGRKMMYEEIMSNPLFEIVLRTAQLTDFTVLFDYKKE